MRILSRWMGWRAAFVYPVPPAPPTAVLQPWFRSRGLVRVFGGGAYGNGWSSAVTAFAPAAIAATWPQLEALMPQDVPSLTHALIVLARSGDPLLTRAQREKLWRVFGVPVFEQIVDQRGELLAAECEAHDGLHLELPRFPVKGWNVDSSPCGCGRKTPRLKPVIRADLARTVASYAR